jgi:hypothetical protein
MTYLFKKSKCSQKAMAGKLNIGLARAKEIIADLGYKKSVCLMRPHQLMPKMKTAKLEAC